MQPESRSTALSGRIVISVDAMGGDRGPVAVIGGLAEAAARNPDADFILHGPEDELNRLLAKRPEVAARCTIRHAAGVVTMEDKPGQVMRHGEGTSMWSAIESVRNREAAAAVSCGNTGALMALSVIRLRKLPGVNRPAIACLWPSRNPGGFNVMLDVGADIKAEAPDLLQFALMGASYARNGLGLARPRIGLLNVGTEEHKGRVELKAAHELIGGATELGQFDYVGFVEGGDLPSGRVDVIVTDGFTGNVVLKLMEEFSGFILKLVLGELKAHSVQWGPEALGKIKKHIDYAEYGGALLLGVQGIVVKGHGRSDANAVSNALVQAVRALDAGVNQHIVQGLTEAGAPDES